jgi:hypothetical protein
MFEVRGSQATFGISISGNLDNVMLSTSNCFIMETWFHGKYLKIMIC